MKRRIILLGVLLCWSPCKAQTTLVVTRGTPTLDGVIEDGEWTSATLVTQAGVRLHAMADSEYFYLAASWVDSTLDAAADQWRFDGTAWSRAGNDDRIAFLWEMGRNGGEGPRCSTMCHGHVPMHATNGLVDLWQWRSARGGAVGFADDQYMDVAGPHDDPGTAPYQENEADANGVPLFMASGDPGVNAEFLAMSGVTLDGLSPLPAHKVAKAIPSNTTAVFEAGSVIPGYVHRLPSGDGSSVRSGARHADGRWTVEFKRSFRGGPYDFTVVPGSSVSFTHEIFDNITGVDHHMNNDDVRMDSFDPTVYTLDFSQITGDRKPTRSDHSPLQVYPNPFNAVTTVELNLPERGFVRLTIVDVLGKAVQTLINEELGPGTHYVTFDASGLASGVYFAILSSDRVRRTQTLLRIE